MKRYLYIDRERLALKQPCVAIRDERGNLEYRDDVWILYGRMRAPHGQPLTPTGSATWVEARILTVGHVRCLVALGVAVFWLAVLHWGARVL